MLTGRQKEGRTDGFRVSNLANIESKTRYADVHTDGRTTVVWKQRVNLVVCWLAWFQSVLAEFIVGKMFLGSRFVFNTTQTKISSKPP